VACPRCGHLQKTPDSSGVFLYRAVDRQHHVLKVLMIFGSAAHVECDSAQVAMAGQQSPQIGRGLTLHLSFNGELKW
jgi:hypothetical protein